MNLNFEQSSTTSGAKTTTRAERPLTSTTRSVRALLPVGQSTAGSIASWQEIRASKKMSVVNDHPPSTRRIAELYQDQSRSYHMRTGDNTRVLQCHHRCPFPRSRLSENSIEMSPHRLTDAHKQVRANICQSLPLHLHQKEFLKSLVTGGESWILYDNDARYAIWLPRDAEPPTQSKPNPTNANISSSFGAMRKRRYTTSCFLQAGLSQLPSTPISFKN